MDKRVVWQYFKEDPIYLAYRAGVRPVEISSYVDEICVEGAVEGNDFS